MLGEVKHLCCTIGLPHRVPGKNNLEWFPFFIKKKSYVIGDTFYAVTIENTVGIQERRPFFARIV